MITVDEFLRNGEKLSELTEQQRRNTIELLSVMNVFRFMYGKPMVVTSGYRSKEYNLKIGGSAKSAHVQCKAIDIKDDGTIKQYIKENVDLCERLGLYFEHFDHTPSWVHFTIRPPKSGNRFFRP